MSEFTTVGASLIGHNNYHLERIAKDKLDAEKHKKEFSEGADWR
jgi:hypothetical protein